MMIEFKQEWRDARKGDIRNVDHDVATAWIDKGIAKAIQTPPANKAITRPRGRPRKAVEVGG